MLSRSYKDWFEWIALERTRLVGAYLRVVYDLSGRAQTPPTRFPKAQPPHLDEFGWAQLPPGWERTELPTLTLWLLARGQDGPPHLPVEYAVDPVGPHLGHEVVEGLVCEQLPSRLPDPPFAGQVQFEVRVNGRRLSSRSMRAEVGWTWKRA